VTERKGRRERLQKIAAVASCASAAREISARSHMYISSVVHTLEWERSFVRYDAARAIQQCTHESKVSDFSLGILGSAAARACSGGSSGLDC
jgi:hypothetical protein